MKRALSFIIFTALFLIFGFMAFSSLPGRSSAAQTNPDTLVENSDIQPAAPLAQTTTGPKYNAIALPLDATVELPNAQAIADAISGTQVVLSWNVEYQTYDFWYPNYQYGTNFPTTLGGGYLVQVDSSAPLAFTVVGEVPPPTGEAGAVEFSISGGTPCMYNLVTIPLDQDQLTDAQSLADDIGNIDVVLQWNVEYQTYDFWYPNYQYGTNFDVMVGHPYMVCSTAEKIWPQP